MSILFYHQNYLVFNYFMCLMCCAFLPPRFYRKFDLYLLRCGTKTQDMPLPREKTSSVLFSEYLNMDPGEIEFLAEKEKIDIIPNFTHGIMHLIQGTLIFISYLN